MGEQRERDGTHGVSRRQFLKGMGGGIAATGLLSAGISGEPGRTELGRRIGPGPARLPLHVNGRVLEVDVEPRHALLEVLRDRLDLTG